MINPHLSQIPMSQDKGIYWPAIIDSVFSYIEEVYPYMNSILVADDLASTEDPNYGTVYYDIMWRELEPLTTKSIHKAITNLASLWRTAWENAGSPSPLSIPLSDHNPKSFHLENNYPNPFNPKTIINYELPITNYVKLNIFNQLGEKIVDLVSDKQSAGKHTVEWDATGYASGIYYFRIEAGEFQDAKKMVLLR
jgi:hypothetical protein